MAAPPPNDFPAGAGVFAPYSGAERRPDPAGGAGRAGRGDGRRGRPALPGRRLLRAHGLVPRPRVGRRRLDDRRGESGGRPTRSTSPPSCSRRVAAPPPPRPPPPPRDAQSSNRASPTSATAIGAGAGGDAADRVVRRLPARPGRLSGPDPGRPPRRRSAPPTTSARCVDARGHRRRRCAGPRAATSPRSATRGSARARTSLDLAGATITGEDPAQPPCPSLGTVWRKLIPGSSGLRVISVSGLAAATPDRLRRPPPERRQRARLRHPRARRQARRWSSPVKRNRPLWVRVGTDRFVGDEAAPIRVRDGAQRHDRQRRLGRLRPDARRPGGGFPRACDTRRRRATRASAAARLTGRAGAYNRFMRIPLARPRDRPPICDATLRLVRARRPRLRPGPHDRAAPGRQPQGRRSRACAPSCPAATASR